MCPPSSVIGGLGYSPLRASVFLGTGVGAIWQVLDLHARPAAEGVPHEKALLRQQIALTDRQIDRLVYDLYGLTAEEIAVVEAAAVNE